MNELKSSNSAYLKHHAQNPIHWKTWSEVVISEFWQKEKKLFKDVFEVDDQVIPSSNSAMASNLYEIYKVTYDKYFLKICNKYAIGSGIKCGKFSFKFHQLDALIYESQ